MPKKFKCTLLSWEDITKLSRKVSKKIQRSNFKPDLIVGITRGGWIPSMLLSDELSIRDLLALKIEHWGITARKDKKARIKFPLDVDLTRRKVLLVDDLTDTGESIKLAISHLKNLNAKEIKVATLIHKSKAKFEPDFYARKVEKWKWIIFPWNLNEDLSNLINKILRKDKKATIEKIKSEFKKEFGIEVEKKTLNEILEKKKK
jgi:hypothetical protein